MQIAIKRFARNGDGFWFAHGGTRLCAGILCKFFDVALDARTIWVSLHSTTSAMRHEAGVTLSEYGNVWITLTDARDPKGIASRHVRGTIERILKRLVGKTVWVQVEYEE